MTDETETMVPSAPPALDVDAPAPSAPPARADQLAEDAAAATVVSEDEGDGCGEEAEAAASVKGKGEGEGEVETAGEPPVPLATSLSSWFSSAPEEPQIEQQPEEEPEQQPQEESAPPTPASVPSHVSRKSEAERQHHMDEVNRLQEEYEREEKVDAAEEAGHAFFLKEEKLEEGGEGIYFPEEQLREPRPTVSSKDAPSPGGAPWRPDVFLPPKVREACEKLIENRTGQVLNLGNGGSSRRPIRPNADKPDDADLTSTSELLSKSRRSFNESPEAMTSDAVVPINDEWVGAIAEALAENHSVKSLWLQNNEITDDGAHKLIDGIKAHHVTCVRIHGRERGPEAWLQHIYFSKNPMTDEAREAIMAAMLWMPPPPKEDVMEEEAMSSIKSSMSSIKPTEEEEKQEDENEKCCCGFCAPMFGLSCC